MKLRKQRKREYIFFPYEGSNLTKKSYIFKRKTSLLKFLNGRIRDVINGTVRVYEDGFGYNIFIRDYGVWYNYKEYNSGADLKIDLKLVDSIRNKRKKYKVSKLSKKHFAFSNRRIELMTLINESIKNNEEINKSHAKNLVNVFYKSGFKDFEPSEEEKGYIEGNIEEGVPFLYWSDRCNYLRMKVVIEYFKRNYLI